MSDNPQHASNSGEKEEQFKKHQHNKLYNMFSFHIFSLIERVIEKIHKPVLTFFKKSSIMVISCKDTLLEEFAAPMTEVFFVFN